METNNISHPITPNNVASVEYLDILSDPNTLGGFASLIAFMGGRHIISDFYDHRPDILCNPLVKILILFSMLYMNIKNVKITIILFFIYIFFIDNYIQNQCKPEYLQPTLTNK
jgi:hypothetical protein